MKRESDYWIDAEIRERIENLKTEGEAYNSSLEERIRICSGELREIKDYVFITNRLLGETNRRLATIGTATGLFFWIAVIYGGYLFIHHFL